MQVNEFEKRVQQVMDEFKIRPSEDVWLTVEQRIQEKKRKRRVLFFILFSSIGLALAGYGVFYFSNKEVSIQNETISSKTITNQQENLYSTDSIKTGIPNNSAIGGNTPTSTKPDENSVAKVSTTSINISQPGRKVAGLGAVSNDETSERNVISGAPNAVVQDEINLETESRISPVGLDQKIETGSVGSELTITSLSDPRLTKLLAGPVKQDDKLVNNDRPAARISRKIQWGINFSAGSSVITDNRFSLKNLTAQFDASYGSPNSSAGGGAAGRFPASSNEAVFAFKVGAVVKKQISLRSNLSAGLQYAYLGDRIKAASTSTSPLFSSLSVGSYYRAVPQKTHEGHFHFIELPMLYHWRMSKNDKRFLSLNAGASVGYLLATNALTYDTSFGGIYLHNKSLFTKAHVNLISGISYHVAGNLEWSIGPQFSFDLSRVINSDLDQRKYFLYGGIDTRIFFPAKKKK